MRCVLSSLLVCASALSAQGISDDARPGPSSFLVYEPVEALEADTWAALAQELGAHVARRLAGADAPRRARVCGRLRVAVASRSK